MTKHNTIKKLEDLIEGNFYRVSDLQSILKNLGLNYSIFTIRDYETWKCLNYKCGKRYNEEVATCEKCGGPVRPPLIESPRTRGGGKGPGHRRYSANEIIILVEIFKQRT